MVTGRLASALGKIGAVYYLGDGLPASPDLFVIHMGRVHAFVFRRSRPDQDRVWAAIRGRTSFPPGVREVSSDEEVLSLVLESSSKTNPTHEVPPSLISLIVRLEAVADPDGVVTRTGWEAMCRIACYERRYLTKLLKAGKELGMLDWSTKPASDPAHGVDITVKIHSKWAPAPKRAFFVRKRRRPRLCKNCSALALSENRPDLCPSCYQRLGRRDRSWHREARRLAGQGVGILSIYARLSAEREEYTFPDGEVVLVPKYDISLYSRQRPKASGKKARGGSKIVQPSLADVLVEANMDPDGSIARAQSAYSNGED